MTVTPAVSAYSTTPANNVQANTGVNWDEGMAPAAVNNSARQNMADLRSFANDLIWFKYGKGDQDYSPVYASGTTFTVAGADVTAVYHTGRRVKAVGSSTGTIYGYITSSSFSTNTTVTVVWDSGSLSNETLTIYISQIPATGFPSPATDTKIISRLTDGTLDYSRIQKTTGLAQSTTTDIFRFLDPGGTLIGNIFAMGYFTINVVDEGSAANNSTFIYAVGTTGNGASDNFLAQDAINGGNAGVVRGTGLVTTFGIVADGGSGAVKLQITTAASGKTVTVRVSFRGMVK